MVEYRGLRSFLNELRVTALAALAALDLLPPADVQTRDHHAFVADPCENVVLRTKKGLASQHTASSGSGSPGASSRAVIAQAERWRIVLC